MYPRLDRPGPAARSPFAALLLLAPLALGIPTGAAASPLAANTSHVGEEHSFEGHASRDLRAIDLSQTDLTSSTFSSSNLKDALLIDAIAVDAVFSSADLKNADLSVGDFTGADFSSANLKNVIAVNATFVDASLSSANLKNADFSGAHLLGADLSGVGDGQHAVFTGAYIDEETVLAPSIDDSEMWFVVGDCPSNASRYWIDEDRDGDGDTCHGAVPLPEPGGAALLAGAALIALFAGHRRAR